MNEDSIDNPMLLEYIQNQASAKSCATVSPTEARALIDRNVHSTPLSQKGNP